MKTLILTILLTVSSAFAQETNKIQFIGDLYGAGTVAYPAGTKAPKWETIKLTNSILYDSTYYISITRDSKTNVCINGIGARKLVALMREFSNLIKEDKDQARTRIVLISGTMQHVTPEVFSGYLEDGIVVEQGGFYRWQELQNLTPQTLRKIALKKEAERKEYDERQSRWQQYQAMIKQLDEVSK